MSAKINKAKLIYISLLIPTSVPMLVYQGGNKLFPPFKINISYRKSCFFHHGVKFCIVSASFWCKTLISSSILMNFRNFMKKWWKIQLLWKLMYMQLIYLKRKVKWFRNWFCGKKVWFLWKNNCKNRTFRFLTKKLGRLEIFDGAFLTSFI